MPLGDLLMNDLTTRNKLWEEYRYLVPAIVRKFCNKFRPYYSFDELESIGQLGLCRAAELFDETKGRTFKSFAADKIRFTIIDNIRAGTWAPRLVLQSDQMVQKQINDHYLKTGMRLDIVTKQGKRNKLVSLEKLPHTAIKLNFEKTAEPRDDIKKLESCLSKKELQIVNLLLAGDTQVEISNKKGLTKGRINQMMMNVRKRMKSHTYAKQAGYVAA